MAIVKKAAPKKAAPKKAAPKKAAPKKAAAKKATAKKVVAKKSTPKKAKRVIVSGDIPVEKRLKALFDLQEIDSKIDSIRTIRGELPLEVSDLEDEIEGLATRVNNFKEETQEVEEKITNKKLEIKESKSIIKKYEKQQGNARNNREFGSLAKEIEFQNLNIQVAEKKMGEFKVGIEGKSDTIDSAKKDLKERKGDLKHKKKELDEIIAETEKEEKKLDKKSTEAERYIEARLLIAYKRVRLNAKNGLAVVSVERNSCGGCFNKIPPQRQLDIRLHKKIIVCEHCGRILVDPEIAAVEL
ncbi:MAG TPA: hypothetical protein EYN69_00020 [Flavobacteriales bacterium]|nr:hypothetical protein [Flavobacteriales bacterium]